MARKDRKHCQGRRTRPINVGSSRSRTLGYGPQPASSSPLRHDIFLSRIPRAVSGADDLDPATLGIAEVEKWHRKREAASQAFCPPSHSNPFALPMREK
jgi:hypothetical protein